MLLTIPLCANTSCIGFFHPEGDFSGISTGKFLRILSFDCVDIPYRNRQKKPFNHNRLSYGEKVCFEDAFSSPFFAGYRQAVTEKIWIKLSVDREKSFCVSIARSRQKAEFAFLPEPTPPPRKRAPTRRSARISSALPASASRPCSRTMPSSNTARALRAFCSRLRRTVSSGNRLRLGRCGGPRRTGVTATGRSRRTPSSRQGKQRQVGGNPNAGGGDGDGVGDLLANL